ncbi:MAG: nucleotidyltransferase [Verrucomicrobiaceae bacterium]|nr:nucleotidyltransferase [Verrucomicrobiaceae bacterium]
MNKTLIAMAAGMGSRFGGLKQAAKFGGKTMLDFAIEDAMNAGFNKIAFVIRKDIEDIFRETVSKKYENQIDVRYSFQELCEPKLPEGRTKPWGTGHAVLSMINNVNEPFLAINADDYYGRNVYADSANFLKTASVNEYALAGYKLKNTLSDNGTVSRGICKADDNLFLTNIQEHGGLQRDNNTIIDADKNVFTGEEFTSLNFWSFPKEFMQILGTYFEDFLSKNSKDMKAEFYLPFAVDKAIKEGLANAKILPTDEKWQGVTYKDDVPVVENFLHENGRI